jgi:hypothetical protein
MVVVCPYREVSARQLESSLQVFVSDTHTVRSVAGFFVGSGNTRATLLS